MADILRLVPETGSKLDALERQRVHSDVALMMITQAISGLLHGNLTDIFNSRRQYFYDKYRDALEPPDYMSARMQWVNGVFLPEARAHASFGQRGHDIRHNISRNTNSSLPRAFCPLCFRGKRVLPTADGFTHRGLQRHLTGSHSSTCPTIKLIESVVDWELKQMGFNDLLGSLKPP